MHLASNRAGRYLPIYLGISMSTIYAGRAPIRGLGYRQFSMLEFALRYPGWHSLAPKGDMRLAESLARRKVIELSRETRQFRFCDTREVQS